MSKIIKPLLHENGEQVRRRLSKGDWYYLSSIDKYYYYNVYFGEAISTYYVEDSLFHQINIEIGNCFRTREEAEQADIQQILDNLKQYYKNKEGK